MPDLPPRTQAEWHAHAAWVRANYDRTQRHESPDFRYWLCTECGTEKEYHPHDVATFRFEVATHECETLSPPPPAGVPIEETSFSASLF